MVSPPHTHDIFQCPTNNPNCPTLKNDANMPRGRRTDDKKEYSIRVRVNEATRRMLEVKAGKRGVSEYARECLVDKLNGKNESIGEIKGLSALTEMVNISGGDIETFLEEIASMVESGDIELSGGHVSKDGLDMNGFLNACSEAGKDPQSVLDYIAMNIWRL